MDYIETYRNLPFGLKEVELDWDTWRPKKGQQYLVEYKWSKDKPNHYLIGYFSEVRYGYTFHWYWSASSLQLSLYTKGYDKDMKAFQRIWEFNVYPNEETEEQKEEFITDEDITV